jgi:resuscitation-promoting factor RpfB
MPVNGTAIAALGAGAVLLWSALENRSITYTLQQVITGNKPTPGQSQSTPESGGSGIGPGGNAPVVPAATSYNVKLGKAMAAARGWTGSQWDALYALWERESGWDNTATNASSGAYGIPQALPASKMYGGTSNSMLQIMWGLGYIAQRYQTPEGAWAHEEQYGWY